MVNLNLIIILSSLLMPSFETLDQQFLTWHYYSYKVPSYEEFTLYYSCECLKKGIYVS